MENPSKLVALLEQDYDSAMRGGTQDVRETLLAGLNWPTSYWVDCALKWLNQGATTDQEIVNRLNEISENKAYSQSTRHQAFKLSKRWQREQNT
jgi:hypothetical protein